MPTAKTLAAATLAVSLGLGACGDSDNEQTTDAAPASTQSAGKAEEIRGKVLDTTAKTVELAGETAKGVKEKTGEAVEQTTKKVSGAIDSATEAAESRIVEPSVRPESDE